MSQNLGFYPELAKDQPIYFTQPSSQTTIYTNQNGIIQPVDMSAYVDNDWNAGIFSCCDDFSELCCAMCFTPCYQCKLFKLAEEPCWSCFISGLVPLRTKIRTQRKIKGSIIEDFCMLLWCPICTMVQMGTELKRTPPLI